VNQDDINLLLERYKQKIETELARDKQGDVAGQAPIQTRNYQDFKEEVLSSRHTFYERLCNGCERIIKPQVSAKRRGPIVDAIENAHLSITPEGAASLALIAPLTIILLGLFFFGMLPLLFGSAPQMFFVVMTLLTGAGIALPLANMPLTIANSYRLKASNQMVLCIFYVVTHMRHNSNLELAVDFASEHIGPPLSLDMKKVLWNVETGKYDTIKEALEVYLDGWKKWNLEFVESFNLIISSLYENSEERRLNALDKSLTIILEETYEKMLHYAQNLQNPMNMLTMLGIMLPIMGLVILPLALNFLSSIKWYHIMAIYDVLLPAIVYLYGISILNTRPTGYGETDISESNPEFAKYKNIVLHIGGREVLVSPAMVSLMVFGVLLFIGLLPLLLGRIIPQQTLLNEGFIIESMRMKFLGYKLTNEPGKSFMVGPYGIGASVLSLFVTLSLGISLGMYFRNRSRNLMKIRENSKKLESEFASSLFQLGNRLGDNIPAEIAFQKVADVMEGTTSGDFFKVVSMNIRRLGMGLKAAIFDPRIGALVYFPSDLIKSSMKVLVESARKGPVIASQALISVSEYLKEMHRIDERLKDLLAEIISGMKSQTSFMAPAISGIVVGITSMITFILAELGTLMSDLGKEQAAAGGQSMAGLQIFGNADPIPTYYFQLIVGIYIVQLVYILTVMQNGIENGADKLNERHLLGQNMIRSVVLYCILVLIVMFIFNSIAGKILASTALAAG